MASLFSRHRVGKPPPFFFSRGLPACFSFIGFRQLFRTLPLVLMHGIMPSDSVVLFPSEAKRDVLDAPLFFFVESVV